MEKKAVNHTKKTHKNRKITNVFYIATAFLIFIILPTIILTATAHSITCDPYMPKDWSYNTAKQILKPFDNLGFLCRIFGINCDENSISLSPIKKEMVRIYNREGSNGNYIQILIKNWPEFIDYFCDFKNVAEKMQIRLGNPVCPSTIQSRYSNNVNATCPEPYRTIIMKKIKSLKDPFYPNPFYYG